MVHISPVTMPKVSWTTLTAGARQLVVQEGVGDDVVFRGIVEPVVDPEHDGDVLLLAGEEMMTFLAPASRWALAWGRCGRCPWIRPPHPRRAPPRGFPLGSRMAKFLTSQPPKTIDVVLDRDVDGAAAVVGAVAQLVRVVVTSKRSVTATTSMGLGMVFAHGLEDLASDCVRIVDAYLELGIAGCPP
jgi:hypothetical protein